MLKCEFTNGLVGHADLHPWPEKGEQPLHLHLKKLKNHQWTVLTRRAVELAKQEALFCSKNCSLINHLKIPLSHYLIQDIENFTYKQAEQLILQGFKIFKIKLGRPLDSQSKKWLKMLKAFRSCILWRVDFQDELSIFQWTQWKNKFLLNTSLERIDFLEAPFNYQESLWKKNQHLPLALDVWNTKPQVLPAAVVVWKPSRKSEEALLKQWAKGLCKRVVFTHCLAHPVDQLFTAFSAGQFYKTHPRAGEVCGLVQTGVYEPNAFSLLEKGPEFTYPAGPGLGFDELFKKLQWKKWVSFNNFLTKK